MPRKEKIIFKNNSATTHPGVIKRGWRYKDHRRSIHKKIQPLSPKRGMALNYGLKRHFDLRIGRPRTQRQGAAMPEASHPAAGG